MAADHAGGRTGCVEQDALERLAIPPALGGTGVVGDQCGVELQALEVFPNAHQSLGFQIQRNQPGQLRLAFEQVTGLATRCATGVQHALARRQVEQRGGQLCGFILHADPPFGKARQLMYVARRNQANAVLTELARMGVDSSGLQLSQIGVAADLAAIDPQHHRRMGIIGRADGFPMFGPMRLERLLQPARMGNANHRVVFQLR